MLQHAIKTHKLMILHFSSLPRSWNKKSKLLYSCNCIFVHYWCLLGLKTDWLPCTVDQNRTHAVRYSLNDNKPQGWNSAGSVTISNSVSEVRSIVILLQPVMVEHMTIMWGGLTLSFLKGGPKCTDLPGCITVSKLLLDVFVIPI